MYDEPKPCPICLSATCTCGDRHAVQFPTRWDPPKAPPDEIAAQIEGHAHRVTDQIDLEELIADEQADAAAPIPTDSLGEMLAEEPTEEPCPLCGSTRCPFPHHWQFESGDDPIDLEDLLYTPPADNALTDDDPLFIGALEPVSQIAGWALQTDHPDGIWRTVAEGSGPPPTLIPREDDDHHFHLLLNPETVRPPTLVSSPFEDPQRPVILFDVKTRETIGAAVRGSMDAGAFLEAVATVLDQPITSRPVTYARGAMVGNLLVWVAEDAPGFPITHVDLTGWSRE